MRDPKRIEQILSLLQKIWEQQPDLRFNQLIHNLQFLYSKQNNDVGKRKVYVKEGEFQHDDYYVDLFYLEDDKREAFLNEYLSEIEGDKG